LTLIDRSSSAAAGEAVRDGLLCEVLVDLLSAVGVEVVFGIGGTHTLPFLGALERRGAPRFVNARNEQGAAYMAVAYARRTRQPAVLLTSTGPGALNAASGLADALWSSIPILHLTTTVTNGDFAADIHETPTQHDVLAGLCRAVVTVEASQLAEQFTLAWNRCVRTPRGPVTLEFRSKDWHAQVAPGPASRVPEADPGEAGSADLRDLADQLNAANRPVIYAGGGLLRSSSESSAMALAERIDAPVVTSFQGKGVANWDHPLYVGPWASERAVQDLLASSDLVLAIGSKLSAVSTGVYKAQFGKQTVRVDPVLFRHREYAHMSHVSDSVPDVAAVLKEQTQPRDRGSCRLVEHLVRDVRLGARERSRRDLGFVEAIGAVGGADTDVCFDMNKASFWMMKFLAVQPGSSHHFSSYLCMGSALPYAAGISAGTGRNVVALMGDGGFAMAVPELASIAEQGLPVSIVVFVDGAFGLLRDNAALPTVRGSRELGMTIQNPKFDLLARSFGIDHFQARSGEELAVLLREHPAQPRLIEVAYDFSKKW
jgi:acetolactate synthase-1/2/3 large subunit